MNKDHVLFLVIGLLSGFLLGYVAHEVMASRQPMRATFAADAGNAGVNSSSQPPRQAPQPGGGGGGPAMEQVQQLRAYVEKNPNDSQAVRELANLNYDINNWQRAAELYEQYLRLVPDEPNVMTDLGACLRNLGRSTEALAVFQRAREKAPEHWQARYNEVLVLAFDLGRWDDADKALSELLKLQPTNPDVTHLADEFQRKRPSGA